MATKRPHSAIHPSRQEQVPVERTQKKRKTNPHPSRSLQPSTHATNPLKSRIRSLTRQLARDDTDTTSKPMPADIRIGHERELASLRSQLADAERARRKSEMISKFHMVRFFDKQKAVRRLKRARRELAEAVKEDSAEVAAKADEVRRKEVDVDYAQYYPLDVAYSSLWPTGKKGKKDEEETGGDEAKGDREMWELVKKCGEEGKLDALRNGKVYMAQSEGAVQAAAEKKKTVQAAKDAKASKKQKAEKQKAKAATAPEDEDEESDGGFFE
ncbi:hypothetical protein MBLNU457_6400t1 [Dothideomycetes sp. NU457]